MLRSRRIYVPTMILIYRVIHQACSLLMFPLTKKLFKLLKFLNVLKHQILKAFYTRYVILKEGPVAIQSYAFQINNGFFSVSYFILTTKIFKLP